MKLFLIFCLIIFFTKSINAKEDDRKFYEERAKFIKNYISIIKEEKKKNKNFKGSVVESLNGQIFIQYGIISQKKLDNIALSDCKKAEGIDCLVRFKTLKKNLKYNRLAEYKHSKKKLKVLGEYMNSKKIYSVNNVNFLINIKDFENKRGFVCTKVTSKYKDIVDVLRKEIEIYPKSFLKKSGLKYVVICEKIIDENFDFEPAGIAPGHYDQSPGIFYLNLSLINKNQPNKKNMIIKIFHHEFYHIIDATLALIILDDKWNKINEQKYSEKYLVNESGINNSVKGYISEYARSNAAEDKAELFAYMITKHKKFKEVIREDEILYKKSQLMITRLKSISKDINKDFWKKLY